MPSSLLPSPSLSAASLKAPRDSSQTCRGEKGRKIQGEKKRKIQEEKGRKILGEKRRKIQG